MSLKEKLKVRFTIRISKTVNIPKGAKSVFVEWRRGSRRRTGRTKIVDVLNNEANWNEDIVIETKIETSGELDRNQTLEARNFQEKRISISVKEGKKTGLLKSHRSIGKAYFNLSEYIRGDNIPVPITRALTTKASRGAGKEPTVTFTIKSELLKLGRVTLTPVRDPAAVPAAGPRSTINLGGTNYVVRPEESHTETTLDSDSDSQGGEDFNEEDDDNPSYPTKTGPSASSTPSMGGGSVSNLESAKLHQRTSSISSTSTYPNNPPNSVISTSSTTTSSSSTKSTPTSASTTTSTSTSSSTAPRYQYSYTPYTPPPEKKYSGFADRPLPHKILAILAVLCTLLFLRVLSSSS